jgi:hypothetical protein
VLEALRRHIVHIGCQGSRVKQLGQKDLVTVTNQEWSSGLFQRLPWHASRVCWKRVKGMRSHPLLVILQASLNAIHLLRELQECAASANHNALLNSGLQGDRACQISLLQPQQPASFGLQLCRTLTQALRCGEDIQGVT